MKKVVIAVDSFKGSLTATEVAESVTKAFNDVNPECEVVSLPLSDGGEGLTEVLVNHLGGRYHTIDAVDPLMRPIKVQFGAVGRCAIIEMAAAAGLTFLSDEERNPMNTSTYGVGVMMQAALDLGYRKFLIGIGGSATNDAGLGAMQALGLRCYNSQGRVIKEPIKGSMLQDVTHLDLIIILINICVELNFLCYHLHLVLLCLLLTLCFFIFKFTVIHNAANWWISIRANLYKVKVILLRTAKCLTQAHNTCL